MPSLVQSWALPAALLAIVNITATWYNLVSQEVPQPYLDEYFHVPQAKKFCKGDYSWDPKITTPPGLYLITKLLEPFLGCETSSLRTLNAIALCIICPLSYGILRMLRTRTTPGQLGQAVNKTTTEQPALDDQTVVHDAHSALNIALFPPLFFFSALYYTDITSTLVVLLSYSALLKKQSPAGSVLENINTVFIGAMALLFRQTNIFWVAVFPVGLAVIDALKKSGPPSNGPTKEGVVSALSKSWSECVIYDCSVNEAEPQDYVLLVLSTAIVAVRKPLLVLQVAVPYFVLLILFAGFVAWNGSVVLGDKSAHTATVHLPQMLYFWPYIVFFSLPLVIGLLFKPMAPFLPKQLKTICNDGSVDVPKSTVPGLLMPGLFSVGALAAVHFNTIVHPYTLADNRHFVFYVFRIIRRHPAIKYLAVPVYTICATLTLQSLCPSPVSKKEAKQKHGVRPTSDWSNRDRSNRQPCQVSFITIWLVTTTLSVVSAPLVEPRYFIIPWIIWRLHVPSAPASLSRGTPTNTKAAYDLRLVFETLWLLAINAAVSYMFLYRGFLWPSEPDSIQRFLW
ncbi:glycosyltransferase family 59 protein [Dothidotthia symphoricarpi CBS 119687]|uniref:Dol-P-Glc:Glc(2)Man(9)GlcNAc(2)-PP-Dol alpha-1,2-glucosyltransferase n=1 Tax=Dothidotthia symphoricarpi CBS 119687 TaxID=1392245 RepID=A0A6A6A857_9PLEO|nr:glycosyltransferase family 59 protein [Dothidotthia symphoricarpi CBS 119687]KAF2127264.1 glycosyltransferase family 59 protein [Dothidotthia symphoricarpi CBS 119687]